MRLWLRRGSQPATEQERMAHRVRWRVRHRMAIDRQLAIAVQEPLHHREGSYALGFRLDREGDSKGTGARPKSQGRRYREKTKEGPLVEPHLELVRSIIAAMARKHRLIKARINCGHRRQSHASGPGLGNVSRLQTI